MKIKLIILLFVLVIVSCTKESMVEDQTKVFLKFFGGDRTNTGADVKQLSDGCYILLGTTATADSGTDIYLAKADKYGNKIWNKEIGGLSDQTAYGLQVLSDGSFVIVGKTLINNNIADPLYNILLIKTDGTGNVSWSKKIGGEDTSAVGYCIQVVPEGGFIIAGSAEIAEGNIDAFLVLTDNDGNIIRKANFGQSENDFAKSIIPYSEGYIVTGSTQNSGLSDILIFATDKRFILSNMKTLGTASGNDNGECIKLLPDGSFLCMGTYSLSGDLGLKMYLIRFAFENDAFVKKWENTYGSSGVDEEGKSVEVIDEQTFALTGVQTSADGNQNIFMVTTDALGKEISNNTFGETGNQISEKILKTKDGGLVIIGTNSYSNNSVIALVKTNVKGQLEE